MTRHTKAPAPERGGRREQTAAHEPPKFFQIIPPNPGIDFIGLSPKMAVASTILIVLAFASMFYRGGLNYGIDFAGGTMVEVRFPQPVPVSDVRGALDDPAIRQASVQDLGGQSRDFQIRVQGGETEVGSTVADAVKRGLQAKFGEGSFDVLRAEAVGPKVGKDLWRQALLAVAASMVVMGIYIWIRFELAFGVGAAVALLHTVLIAVGALLVFNMEFDLTTVAALLTVVGFSVNDTVVISDRIRESAQRLRKEPIETVINVAINETLSRTVINSGTVILVSAALFLLGGPVIHSFAFAMFIGFVIGTYSSIFVATPIVLAVERRRRGR